ncbi:Os02g0118800 [Oryza sativa Japonica Group]|uniref:Os02g0118800 protein n=1 Tax=Oryza sativa subsp. japonica TaxID=39947 RepID=A0A0P0VDY1_ORYSJ|nr:hypothetical protein EE612_008484 [Oryza sativa]BAS76680.1 Os02g0118800 [Oryza sativa Japonica Group]
MNEIITWVIHGRKRKRDEDEPTHSIMLPLEIKHDISQRINGIVNCLHIRNKSVQGVLQLEISRPIVVPKQTQSVARGARLTTSIPIERKVYGRDAMLFVKPQRKEVLLIKAVLDLFGAASAKSLEQKNRPWAKSGYKLGEDVEKIFNSAAEFCVGNGKDTKFWTANWLNGGSIAWRWPVLSTYVGRSQLTVAQALTNNRWVRDLQGALSNEAMAQFFQLWDEVHTVELNLEEDTIRWKLSSDGLFTVSSAYNLFFMAREICPFSELIWHIKAPSRVRFFLWLAAKGRCLTADNLGKRGWQHEDCCSLCQSEAEDCLHLFVTCAFTRRVWRMMQGWIGINFLLPTENEPALADWWMKARMAFRTGYRSIFDSVFALTCWLLWKECNARVFEQKFRSIEQLVQDIKEEAIVWKTTGVFTTSWKILPLEEMRALKELELMDVPVVEELSVPSLEKLVLIQMPSLQRCSGITTSSLPVSTSQIHQKKLVSSLHKLTIHDCPSLIVSLPIPPSLISDLSVKGISVFPTINLSHGTFSIESNELNELDNRILPFHNLKGLRSMYLQHCPNLSYVSSEVFSQLVALEHLSIEHCPNLFQPHSMSEPVHENSILNTDHLVLPSLRFLKISSCGIVGRWLTQMLPHLLSLEYFLLSDCPQIKLLSINQPTETEATSSLASVETASSRDEQILKIPCNLLRSLKWLRIWECADLEFSGVNRGFSGFTSLVMLQIRECPKLVSSLVTETNDTNVLLPQSLEHLDIGPLPANLQSYFPKGLPCLKKLSLNSGEYLKSVQLHSCSGLEYLQISRCPHLSVLEGLQHLSSLRRLCIQMNPELSAAWDLKLFPLSLVELGVRKVEGSFHSRSLSCLPSITKLEIQDSPELVSLQLGYCTSLEKLEITNCKSLASIKGIQSIRNLRYLKVLFAPSLPPYLHGVSGIWSRLETLQISNAAVLSTPLCKQLTALRELMFLGKQGEGYDGETMVSLTEEQERALQLLTSLRVLAFSHLQNLKSLPTNLQSLDCLDELYISVCPSILRLPQMGLPPSLRYLSLYRCSEELCVQCRMAETANLRVGIYSASAIPRPGYGTWYRLLGGLAQSSTRDVTSSDSGAICWLLQMITGH